MLEAIKDIINKGKNVNTRDELDAIKRAVCKKYKIDSILNADIIKVYKNLVSSKEIELSPSLEGLLRKRSIRTMSGVAPVAVLTKAYPCPGTCAYCPRQDEVPVSYLSNEPAVMRAIRCHYNPYTQVFHRLRALENNGHHPEKIELIVIGGTWSYLPEHYKYWYILNCFKAANDYGPETEPENKEFDESTSLLDLKKLLLKEQERNELARYRIIGLTLETRPDYIDKEELEEMRDLGCTRVEIGVQAIDDDILNYNKRGHGVKEVVEATKLLKRYGFKVTYHLMPGLPSATTKKDLAMFKQLFSDESFQPDQIKFYPTVVVEGSLLYQWYKQGKYKPYSDLELQTLIIDCKAVVPKYVRIIRLIRDIPAESIVAGNKVTNLRQLLQQKGVKCNCIRCREAKSEKIKEYKLNTISYKSSSGTEHFISADSLDGQTLYGFCRLRLDDKSPVAKAIIRELHVYGELVQLGAEKKVQHQGLGKILIAKAEELSVLAKADSIAVISGIGVRGYYKKLGYKLKKTYLVKDI